MQNLVSPTLLSQNTSWDPHFHFYKLGHWINDPNGLFYLNGKYHLFFQLNPDATVWGNMHWGAAESIDLITWKHKPMALYAEPEGLGYIFSGGAVVDINNTSGFGIDDIPPVIATFTQQSVQEEQVQSIAFSVDGGDNFTMFEQNPVIANPGLKDFRDPKVVWFDGQDEQYWVKAVVAGQCVHFYKSTDLKKWTKLSEFGENIGAHGGVWECPDLFPLRCHKTGLERWVLLISINPGGPNGGSATQYFIGNFDGVEFTSQDKETRWLDHGTDCYAGITWDNTPNILEERLYTAWMSNWNYANDTPDDRWRGAMTLPRKIKLSKSNGSYCLLTPAFPDFDACGTQEVQFESGHSLPQAYKLALNVSPKEAETNIVWTNEKDEVFSISINLADKKITVDRSQAGFSEKGFNSTLSIPIVFNTNDTIHLEVYADTCSFECFFNDGEQCITTLVFPSLPFSGLDISEHVNNVIIKNLEALA
ncbi:MAG: glycoside hydrolase family 32 protein [Paraglaciecola sp.]|uniref:glycoside hydrolase family 32 protein n=1 Tax=Paraglaciecola sp. TaxID=1920173 RepID=UPI00329893FC